MIEICFEKAFELYIQNQKVTGWGFLKLYSAVQRNGYRRDLGGYYTEYENGYRLICNGENLGQTPVQEALILDPEGIPIARDVEDLT